MWLSYQKMRRNFRYCLLWVSQISELEFIVSIVSNFSNYTNYLINLRDAQTLYGVKKLRKKIFSQKRKRDNSDSASEKTEDIVSYKIRNDIVEFRICIFRFRFVINRFLQENDVNQEERELNDSTTVDGQHQTKEQFKKKRG